jgi:hypothetical protein
LITIAAIVSLALIAFVGMPGKSDSKVDAALKAPASAPAVSSPEARQTSAPTRLVYPYSVVPGGVLTPDEVERAMARDPVVASHYAGLNPRALRVVHLLEPRDAYVSYRIGNQVYWTSRKLRLKVGEAVLTDGNITVRARCGNQVADSALGPVSPSEPSADLLDSPADPTLVAGLPAAGSSDAGGAPLSAGGFGTVPPDGEWASASGSSQPRGTVLWPGFAGRQPGESGSGSPGPNPDPGGDPPPSFRPDPPPNPGPNPPPPPGDPKPKPTAQPDPGPDPQPDPKFGPKSDPDPGPHPRNDPRPGPPPSKDPDDGPVPVPEPTTLVLVGIGAGSAVIRHLRKRRSAQR